MHAHVAAGELHPLGDEELFSLGARLRQRFPSIVCDPYFPKRYPIISTQVSPFELVYTGYACVIKAPQT